MSSPDQPRPPAPQKRRQLPSPKGTRDFYPEDLLRRRYIEKAWRDTSIRHGFEEIEGPTFETAELYKVKSGEGILGEMFGVFSGKAEEDLKQLRETGEAPLALRPEFTPTLARMYAARAAQLPKPTKWFTAGPYFRAEKPQRGRLREFCQWNCDILGGDDHGARCLADAEVISVQLSCFANCGLTPSDLVFQINDRRGIEALLQHIGLSDDKRLVALSIIDQVSKKPLDVLAQQANEVGFDLARFLDALKQLMVTSGPGSQTGFDVQARTLTLDGTLFEFAKAFGQHEWIRLELRLVRGLAYYTGTVFEAIAEGERAVCGGGRYDNLIELFGGPPTPAVGFGMGDVVLGNLLQDKGLMPEGPALLEALSAPAASLRPDVFVISNGSEAADPQVRPLVARLRRGQESEAWAARESRKPWDKDRYSAPPLHARHSYKATKNIGKLLEDARKSSARFAAIIENAEECSLKNLDTGQQLDRVKLTDLATAVSSQSSG